MLGIIFNYIKLLFRARLHTSTPEPKSVDRTAMTAGELTIISANAKTSRVINIQTYAAIYRRKRDPASDAKFNMIKEELLNQVNLK